MRRTSRPRAAARKDETLQQSSPCSRTTHSSPDAARVSARAANAPSDAERSEAVDNRASSSRCARTLGRQPGGGGSRTRSARLRSNTRPDRGSGHRGRRRRRARSPAEAVRSFGHRMGRQREQLHLTPRDRALQPLIQALGYEPREAGERDVHHVLQVEQGHVAARITARPTSRRIVSNLTAVLRRVRARSEPRDGACRAAPPSDHGGWHRAFHSASTCSACSSSSANPLMSRQQTRDPVIRFEGGLQKPGWRRMVDSSHGQRSRAGRAECTTPPSMNARTAGNLSCRIRLDNAIRWPSDD
jgi:hypothetical protein